MSPLATGGAVETTDASGADNTSIIDKRLKDLELCMVEVDGTMARGQVITTLFLYDWLETLINIAVAAVLSHAWTIMFHCVAPNASYHIWSGVLSTLVLALSVHSLLKILYMTGRGAMEVKVAGLVSIMTFTAVMMLLASSIDISGLSLTEVLNKTATHINALAFHISPQFPKMAPELMVGLLKIFISALCALTAAGMVIPAMRFSQTFFVMTMGADNERGTKAIRLLLLVDYVLPLLVALSMIPNGGLSVIAPLFREPGTMKFTAAADGYWLGAQLCLVGLLVVVRLSCLRLHLQCFLDAVVRSISVEIALAAGADSVGIQNKVSMRYQYIAPGALQYVALPLTLLGLALLVHRNAAAGTGLCVGLKQLLSIDPTANVQTTATFLSRDTTAIVNAALPNTTSLEAAVHLFLMHAGQGGVSPSKLLYDFAGKANESLFLFPTGAFMSLGRAAIALHCVVWFAVYTGAIMYWYLNPVTLQKTTGGVVKIKDE